MSKNNIRLWIKGKFDFLRKFPSQKGVRHDKRIKNEWHYIVLTLKKEISSNKNKKE